MFGNSVENDFFCIFSVEEDDNADSTAPSNETAISSSINGTLETSREGSPQAKQAAPGGEGEDQSVKKPRRRSMIWQHFKRLESLKAVQCQICMKKLQWFTGGCTSNLHRHMSKRHPRVLLNQQQPPTPNSNLQKTITLRRHDERMPGTVLILAAVQISFCSNSSSLSFNSKCKPCSVVFNPCR